MVGLQPEVADRFPSELSGGMIKRVALARALALDPELVFLDEPTSGLDPIGAGDFDELVRTLQRTLGLTVFMVTHDLDSLYTACDRIAVLGNGKIIAAGSMADMQASQHPWLRAYFHGKRARALSVVLRVGIVGVGLDGNAGEFRPDRIVHAGGDCRGVRLCALVPEPAHHQGAQPDPHHLRRPGVGPAQRRQRQFQRYPGRRGDFGEARQPASRCRTRHGREQRPDPQGHPGRARIPGADRRRRDLAEGRRGGRAPRSARRGRRPGADRRSERAAGRHRGDPRHAAEHQQGGRRQPGSR